MAHTYDPSTGEAEAGGLPQVCGQFALHSEFKARLNYIVRPVTNNNNNKKILFMSCVYDLPLVCTDIICFLVLKFLKQQVAVF